MVIAMTKGIAVGASSGITAGALYAVATPGVEIAAGTFVGLCAGIVAGVLWQLLSSGVRRNHSNLCG